MANLNIKEIVEWMIEEAKDICFGAGIGRQGSLKNFCASMWVQVPSETPWASCVAQTVSFPKGV